MNKPISSPNQKSGHIKTLLGLATLFMTPTSATADTATFTLTDNTKLNGTHKVYVLGYSATPGYYLKSDGTWTALPEKSGQIPCYEMGSDTKGGQIDQVTIDSSQSTLSARVYFFVDDTGSYSTCNNGKTSVDNKSSNETAGIFGTSAFSYTYTAPPKSSPPGTVGTYGVVGITQANIGAPGTGLPVYSFAEIGPGPTRGTIDASQVDLFSFPFTVEAQVSSGPEKVGNSAGISFTDNSVYQTYIKNIAGKPGCPGGDITTCAYLDLISAYGNGYHLLLNPGGFLNSNTSAAQNSKLQSAFDGPIGKLWSTDASSITLSNGGPQGQAPEDTFTSEVVSMVYPCNDTGNGCPSVNAIKFTGKTSNYVAYIFSPKGYADGCAANTITGCPAGSIASSGNQVFSGAGVFASTAASEYANLLAIQKANKKKEKAKKKDGHKDKTDTTYLPEATTKYGSATYAAQVARLGLIMTQALNHGVALMTCPAATDTWKCWNNESNWYPVKTSKTYPDITQNLYARFMHTATNKAGTAFFTQPPNAVKSAGGDLMGMAYGFSNDENPTPPVPQVTSPEVPSKMDSTVKYGSTGTYSITLGPWQPQKKK